MRRLVIAMVAFTLILVIPGTAAGKPSSPITVDKSAAGHLTRIHSWDITKTATPEVLDIASGGSAISTFDVSVTRTGHVDVSSVAGDICVSNEASAPTEIVEITDEVEHRPGKGRWLPLVAIEVDLGGITVIGPGETHCYPYDIEFTSVDDADYRNVATVSSVPAKGKKLGRVTTKTSFTLPATPDVSVNESVFVEDTNGMSWTFSDTGTETYDRTYTTAGTFTNTATITETGALASATVTVNVSESCATTLDAVAYWCFDDETNPTTDGAGDHHGNVVGAVFDSGDIPPVTGNVAALDFDGADDYVWATDPEGAGNLDGFDGMTLAGWINPDSLTSPWGSRVIVSKYNSSSPHNTISYWLLQRGDEVEVFVSRERVVDEDRLTSTGVDLVPGTWVHVAGTWDGSNLRLFVNGVQVAAKATTVHAMDDSTIQVDIGAAESFADGERSALFDGSLDEVYIFDRALAPAEVARLAGLEATAPWHNDLLLLWDEGAGFSRYGLQWTPGLGFAPSPMPEVCTSLGGGWTPAPQDFPYDIIEVTYNPGTLVRFASDYPTRPVQAWLHDGENCWTPDSSGSGPGDAWYYQFDYRVP